MRAGWEFPGRAGGTTPDATPAPPVVSRWSAARAPLEARAQTIEHGADLQTDIVRAGLQVLSTPLLQTI